MASTATTRNRLEKQGTGDNNNTWGSVLNSSLIDLVDEALDGRTNFTLSTTKTLSSTNYASDESRKRIIDITSGTGGTVTIPAVEKSYLVRNAASGDVIFTTGSGNTATVKSGNVMPIVSDGTNVYLGLAPDFGSVIPKTSGTPTTNAHVTNKLYVDTQIAAAVIGTSMGTGVATFLGTPSSANLLAAMTDETGTGALVFASAPTLVNPVVGTQAQGDNSTKAASTAYVDAAVAGVVWTQIATATPSGTGTVTFSSIPSTYSDLLIVVSVASHNNGSSQDLNIYVSPDNATFGSGSAAIASVTAANVVSGGIKISGYRKDNGQLSVGLGLSATSPVVAASTAGAFYWRCTGGVSAVRIAWAAGNFDAGTLTIYGR